MPRFQHVLLFAVLVCAVLLCPNLANADSLTGSVGITWLFPNTSTVYGADTIAVGSALLCPNDSSPVCIGFGDSGVQSFGVGSSSIAYKQSGFDFGGFCCYADGAFNGFDFTGLTFQGGSSLTGFTLTTDMAGLTASNVTFGPSFIEINLANIPVNGVFTLNLLTSNTPEPSSLAMLGVGMLALAGLTLRSLCKGILI
jgi:hypothetical protein